MLEDNSVAPVENPARDKRWLMGFLNLLCADDEPTRLSAATKIKAMAERKKMLAVDMVLAVLGQHTVRGAPSARAEPEAGEADQYTASGVPRHERRHKAADHNLARLRDAYRAFGDTCDLHPDDRTMIEDVIRIKQFDWELSDRVRRFVRDMTKKLLATGEKPLV